MMDRIRNYFSDPFFQVILAVILALGLGFWLGQEVTFQREGAFPEELRPAKIVERKRELVPLEAQEPVRSQLRPPAPIAEPEPSSLFGEQELLSRCIVDWSRWATQEVFLLENDFLHMRPLFSDDCVQAMLQEVEHLVVLEFLTGCHLGRGELEGWQVGPCLELVPRVRDFVILQMADADRPLAELNFAEVEDRLYAGHRYISELSFEEINRNLELAEELVSRDPGSYLGLKSKLMNLLLLEVKFAQPIDPNEYVAVFDRLLSFDVVGVEEEILLEAYALDPLDPSPLLAAQELMGIDRDLIHLPFVRLSALNDFESLMDISLEYIDFFPESYVGYFYLAESQWRMGDQASAFQALKMGMGLQDSDEMLLRLMSQFQRSPLERIYEMSGSD